MSKRPLTLSIIVGAVILDRNKVLLLQRNAHETVYPNLWELPSGKRHLLERTEDALKREVLEETGLVVVEASPFYVFDYQINKATEVQDSVQINFLANIVTPYKVQISNEHQNFMWATKADLPMYRVTDLTKTAIEKAFKLCGQKEKARSQAASFRGTGLNSPQEQ